MSGYMVLQGWCKKTNEIGASNNVRWRMAGALIIFVAFLRALSLFGCFLPRPPLLVRRRRAALVLELLHLLLLLLLLLPRLRLLLPLPLLLLHLLPPLLLLRPATPSRSPSPSRSRHAHVGDQLRRRACGSLCVEAAEQRVEVAVVRERVAVAAGGRGRVDQRLVALLAADRVAASPPPRSSSGVAAAAAARELLLQQERVLLLLVRVGRQRFLLLIVLQRVLLLGLAHAARALGRLVPALPCFFFVGLRWCRWGWVSREEREESETGQPARAVRWPPLS